MEENERRLLFYVAEKARLKNSANEVCEKFCEIISVRHLTCRNLFLRVGKEFYFGDKIPFFPVNLRGAGNIHSGLYKKASRCVVPNFIKMRIFYEKNSSPQNPFALFLSENGDFLLKKAG